MKRKFHVRCEAGENLEITSKSYLSLSDLADLSAVIPEVYYRKEDITDCIDRFYEGMMKRSEEEYVYNYLAQAIGVVSWKRFAVVADANNAIGITRYLANDFSFTPVLVIVSEPIFRPEDKERIICQISDLEYALPPKVLFLTDQYEINQAIHTEENEITLLVGSSNEREIALEKEIQFILGAFSMNERLVFNRTYAGYKGSLTFTEDVYDNI